MSTEEILELSGSGSRGKRQSAFRKQLELEEAAALREAALFLGRIHGRLSLKELSVLAGGLHHNAVSIAIRRLVERLKRDPDLQRRLSAVQNILSKT